MNCYYFCMFVFLTVLSSNIAAPIKGPFKVTHKTFSYAGMDSTNKLIDVWWPTPTAEQKKFPLISYSHGDGGGDGLLLPGYEVLLSAMSAFGYVVAAQRSCNKGCHDDTTTLPHDPAGFGHYFHQQLLVINWTKNATGDPFTEIDFSKGVGIAGHSMGGQATLYSSSGPYPKIHGITAAVMHHAYTHSFPAPQIPFLVMTGAQDKIAPAHPMAVNIYNAKGAHPSHGIANKKTANHYEPNPMDYNNLLPQYTVAWFKIYLDKTPKAYDIDFNELIFGTGKDNLCHGGDGEMAECEMHK